MMHGPQKSDSAIVAGKPANKVASAAAEWVEPRAGTKGNASQPGTCRTQRRVSVTPGLERVRQAARQRKKERFTALLHHVTVQRLSEAFGALKRRAAPGVDGVTWADYEQQLEGNLRRLHDQVHRGTYRAQPVRRHYIDKPGSANKRALGIAVLEDKIVQRALSEVLNAIYEEDFCGFSYGFRPGRGQHDALDALCAAIKGARGVRVNWILDADIKGFFDGLGQQWLVRFVEHRIGDARVMRLLRQWLRAGVLEDGRLSVSEDGTPQGAVISPLLANVYLHYVFDLWAQQWRRREAAGQVIVVRYADDIVVGFEHEADAGRFWAAMAKRLAQFELELHGDKTRLLEFGREARARREQRGLSRPETFNFLGFKFICGVSRRGGFLLRRHSRGDRMRAKLREVKQELRARINQGIPEQGSWLRAVLRGYYAYHAVPTNSQALGAMRYHLTRLWLRTLRRRSQKGRLSWQRMSQIAEDWLPQPHILHPWPEQRFAVKHPR
jgi:RNA-directed DNA polymerase